MLIRPGRDVVFLSSVAARRASACLTAVAVWLAAGGCGAFPTPDGSVDARSTLALTTLSFGAGGTYFEAASNDALLSAERVSLGEGVLLIRGAIDATHDVDVFDFGAVDAGDRIAVEVSTADTLNGAIALFDDNGVSLLVNDDRNVYMGRKQPFIDVVVRRSSASCRVAISPTPGSNTLGSYALRASVEPGADIPNALPDVVLLDFNGAANYVVGGRPAINVPPFDAGAISPVFVGSTEAMTELIVAAVRADYDGLDVTLLSTSEGDVYDGSQTRLLFGQFDAALLGVAEGVDEFNSVSGQEAIVFTDTFAAFEPLEPDVSQMAQAIGNVASHEIGHLLGLVHTSDPRGIMDVTASLNELMQNQSFSTSPLYSAVFPIGMQDAVQSLLDAVGGKPGQVRARRIWTPPAPSARQLDHRPARADHIFSNCGRPVN